MDEKSLEILEFSEIIRILAGYTSFEIGRELVLEIEPLSDFEKISSQHKEYEEARYLLSLESNFSAGGASDIREHIRMAGLDMVLEPESLIQVQQTLSVIKQVRGGIGRISKDIPHLWEIAGGMVELGDIEVALDVAVLDFGDAGAGVGGAVAVGVALEEILEGEAGLVEVGGVLVAAFGAAEEDGADAVLGLGGDGAVGVFVDDDLVGVDGFGAAFAALPEFADGELGLGRGRGLWGVVPDFGEHLGDLLGIEAGPDAEEAVFDDAVGGGVGDDGLVGEGLAVEGAALVAVEEGLVGVEGVEEFAAFLEEGGLAEAGLGGDLRVGVVLGDLLVEFGGLFEVAGGLRGLV